MEAPPALVLTDDEANIVIDSIEAMRTKSWDDLRSHGMDDMKRLARADALHTRLLTYMDSKRDPRPAHWPTPCAAYGQDHSRGCPASDAYPLDGGDV